MGLNSPSLMKHDASSFMHWREDSLGGHFVVAKAVGPEGGILGLLNTKHFAAEELEGILSLRCSFIIAFDALFWDHLRDSFVCPVGDAPDAPENHFCSGHGQCDEHNKCVCDPMFTGPACQYKQNHVTVESFGHYDVDVPTGGYHYFRVRVPHDFAGGFLEVKVISSEPLIILVSRMGNPTKSQYEMSNFDDWVSGQNTSLLRFRIQHGPSYPAHPDGRMPSQLSSVQQHRRLLDEELHCPSLPGLHEDHAACRSVHYQRCEGSCSSCIVCTKNSSGDGGCTSMCKHCTSIHCLDLLSACAHNVSCLVPAHGGEELECLQKCGGCMACVDSSDENCKKCVPHCCQRCLPVAAKCGLLQIPHAAAESSVVTVGIFHHRGRNKTAMTMANAQLDITLKTDRGYGSKHMPKDVLAHLYDPFRDIRSLALTQRQDYPDGMKFFYTIRVGRSSTSTWVQLFNQRMTLLHIEQPGADIQATPYREGVLENGIELSFKAGLNISHVLTSSWRSPKTVFDFDKVVLHPADGQVRIRNVGRSSLWCAIFASVDSHVQITVQTFKIAHANSSNFGYILPSVLGLITLLGACAVISSRRAVHEGDNKNWSRDTSHSPTNRFSSLVRTPSIDEQAVSLTGDSIGLGGYDQVPQQEEYLNRAGVGDDGI
jgi:hypothetical protein